MEFLSREMIPHTPSYFSAIQKTKADRGIQSTYRLHSLAQHISMFSKGILYHPNFPRRMARREAEVQRFWW